VCSASTLRTTPGAYPYHCSAYLNHSFILLRFPPHVHSSVHSTSCIISIAPPSCLLNLPTPNTLSCLALAWVIRWPAQTLVHAGWAQSSASHRCLRRPKTLAVDTSGRPVRRKEFHAGLSKVPRVELFTTVHHGPAFRPAHHLLHHVHHLHRPMTRYTPPLAKTPLIDYERLQWKEAGRMKKKMRCNGH
jgi:hypothetical protein